MCGLLGYYNINKGHPIPLTRIREALNSLSHRGPDASGELKGNNYFFGHRRLSIIDLSDASNQPFTIEDSSGKITILYNGEIYNYKHIIDEIEPDNLIISDTQALLRGYALEGISFFEKLRGMYAFAIIDTSKNKLFLYRDPAGIKPLYYYFDGETIVFSSEIKAIRKSLDKKLTYNENILKTYLALGYCLEPQTAYNEIQAVEPGQLIEINLENGELNKKIIFRYNLEQNQPNLHSIYLKNTDILITQAVRRNLLADVPLEFALSGGIDSSLLYAKANKDNNIYTGICVGFNDKRYDESNLANLYAKTLNSPIENIKVNDEGNINKLNRILLHFDQPYADSSAIPFNILAENASVRTKVLIGGDGGDEIHNGYQSFRWMPLVWKFKIMAHFLKAITMAIELVKVSSKSRILKRLSRIMSSETFDNAICEWLAWLSPKATFKNSTPWLFDTKIIYDTFSSSFSNISANSIETAMLKNYFYKQLLSDYLRKTDMMSMLNSLEYRVPMLDEDLVAYSFTIPYWHKFKRRQGKKILRELHSTIYPSETSNAPKSGFSIPLDKWLSKSDFEYIQTYLKRNDGIVYKWIKIEYIDFLFEKLFNKDYREVSRASIYQRILIFYSLQLWHFNQ